MTDLRALSDAATWEERTMRRARAGSYEAFTALDDRQRRAFIESLAASPSPDTDREDEIERIARIIAAYWSRRYGEGDAAADPKNPLNLAAAREFFDAGLRPSPDTDAHGEWFPFDGGAAICRFDNEPWPCSAVNFRLATRDKDQPDCVDCVALGVPCGTHV